MDILVEALSKLNDGEAGIVLDLMQLHYSVGVDHEKKKIYARKDGLNPVEFTFNDVKYVKREGA